MTLRKVNSNFNSAANSFSLEIETIACIYSEKKSEEKTKNFTKVSINITALKFSETFS